MKKIFFTLVVTILGLSLVACSSTDNSEKETLKEQEQITKIYLADETISIIEENLNTFTEGTAFEGAKYKIELENNSDLKVSVIKNINDIMTSYKTITSDETVEAIKKSLVFDDAYDVIKEELGIKFECMQVFIFNSEEELNNNEYYTIKTIM